MTEDQAAELLRNAPCQLRHMQDKATGRGRKHAALASWAPHVRCMVAALAGAGLLENLAEGLDTPGDTV